MGWSWRVLSLQYGYRRRSGLVGIEWECATEYLHWDETTINQSSMHDRLSVAHLDHDHRERKNICFFAICSRGEQNLWCGPSHRLIIKEGPLESWVLRRRSETKIRDPRPAGVIHKDVWLYGRQSVAIPTYHMNHHTPHLDSREPRRWSEGTRDRWRCQIAWKL